MIDKINDDVKESFGMKKDVKIEKSCPQCELVSSSNADLKIHIKSCHTKPSISSPTKHKVPKVLQEDLSISEIDDQEIGIKETKKDNPGEVGQDCKWEFCTYTAKDKSDLQKHFEDEHMEYLRRKYLSDWKSCQAMTDDNQLSKDVEGTIKVEDEDTKEQNIEVVTIPSCNACNLETKICADMEEHRRNGHIHNTEEPELTERESVVICGICAKGFENETEFENHCQNHKTEEVHECVNCSETFSSAFDLRRHEKSKHGNISRTTFEICPFCKLESKNLDTLKTHIESIHTRKPSTSDNIQDEISIGKNERNFGEHIQSEHVKPKQIEPFPCQICGLVFVDFTLLQEHVKQVHTVEEHSCKFCKFSTSNRDDIQSHLIDEHEEFVILHTMATEVHDVVGKFGELENFCTNMTNMMKMVMDRQVERKQELYLIRNNISMQSTVNMKKQSQILQ